MEVDQASPEIGPKSGSRGVRGVVQSWGVYHRRRPALSRPPSLRSSSGTRVVKRSGGPGRLLPASVPAARTAFVLPHGERVVLLVGAKTTVTLGPAEKDLQKMKALPLPLVLRGGVLVL